jgi:SMI1-KNR4 cell-wall
MDWKAYITKELGNLDKTTSFAFNLPVSVSSLVDLKTQFGLKELDELYRQTNGVDELSNGKKMGALVWTIDRVIETNKEYRNNLDYKNLYMSFDQLFFISEAGNGDLFCFVTINGRFDRFDIFTWNHEDDSRIWVAPDLKTFIKWWTDGTIWV